MKIAELDNIVCFDVNNIWKFNLVLDKLMPCVVKAVESAPHFNQSSGQVIQIFKDNLINLNTKFKLLIGLDLKNNEMTFFCSAFIVEEDRMPVCLIYAIYAKPGLLIPVADNTIRYLDNFCAKFKCIKMIFHTEHDKNAFARLAKKYNWKPVRTVFERTLEP